MTPLTWSLAANAVLVASLFALWFAARSALVREKVATFAEVLNAVTFGLVFEDESKRFDRIALGLSAMPNNLSRGDLRWRLTRAATLRALRGEPTLADVVDGTGRALITSYIVDEPHAEAVWAYMDGKLDGKDGFDQEPRDRFGDDGLAKAQLHLEGELIRSYEAGVRGKPPSLIR